MTDIVERLNEPCPCSYCDGDAANQRDEAKAEIERLREALREISKHQKRMPNIDVTIWNIARAALEEKK